MAGPSSCLKKSGTEVLLYFYHSVTGEQDKQEVGINSRRNELYLRHPKVYSTERHVTVCVTNHPIVVWNPGKSIGILLQTTTTTMGMQ